MNLKGYQFPQDIILETVRYYLAYKLSYRDIEEIQTERGIKVDHATIHRWVVTFTVLSQRLFMTRRQKSPDTITLRERKI